MPECPQWTYGAYQEWEHLSTLNELGALYVPPVWVERGERMVKVPALESLNELDQFLGEMDRHCLGLLEMNRG